MSKGARNRTKRAAEAVELPEATWADVLDYHGVELIPEDHIVGETYMLSPEMTDEGPTGAPPEIYRDPDMFRLWLERETPDWICGGEGCLKVHPHLGPDTVCHGSGARTRAIRRIRADITRDYREDNPGRKPTPADLLAHLKEKQ